LVYSEIDTEVCTMVLSLAIAAGIVISGFAVTGMGVELTFYPPQSAEARRRVRIALGVSFAILLGFTLWATMRGEKAMADLPKQIADYMKGVVTRPKNDTSEKKLPQPMLKPQPAPRHLVSVICKDSPLFTERREERIRDIVDSFYRYLVNVGFSPPTELPPIGTVKGKVLHGAYILGESPVFYGHLSLPEERIDDPDTILAMYSQWLFNQMFESDLTSPESRFNMELPVVYMCYYRSSFRNRAMCDKNKWLAALWDIRKAKRGAFVDKAMLLAIRPDSYAPHANSFNEFFTGKLLRAVRVLDNDGQDVPMTQAILVKHGLMPQP